MDPVDEQSFIVPATDHNGHHQRFWGTYTPQMARQVSNVVDAKIFPYRSKGDMMRHAVKRHLDWLEGIADRPFPSVMKQVDAILEVMVQEQMAADFESVFDKMQARVADFMSRGEADMAAEMVNRIHGHISQMPEGSWKKRYLEKLKASYGHLVTAPVPLNFLQEGQPSP